MSQLVRYPEEKNVLHAQVAVQLSDAFTGLHPKGQIQVRLVNAATGEAVDAQQQNSSLGVWSFPGLGKRIDTETDFNLQIESEYYDSFKAEGFKTRPYESNKGLTGRLPGPRPVVLLPNQNYPYPSHVPLIRGRVWDSIGDPSIGASVDYGTSEFTKTDQDGFFSLPIRKLPAGIWPPTEVTLTSKSKTRALSVSSTDGINEWTRIELVETNEKFFLTQDAIDGEFTLPINLDPEFDLSGDPDLYFEGSFLAPRNRRYRIVSDESSHTSLLLDSPLRRPLPQGTQFSLRTRVSVMAGGPATDDQLIEIESVNRVNEEIQLASNLRRQWSAGTRVVRYPSRKASERSPLELDINDPNPEVQTDQGQLQALVAVPDHFRFIEIQLPS